MKLFRQIILLFVFVCSSLFSYGQFTHAGRGMYVNKFFKTTLNSSDAVIPDPNRSILSIAAKEDSLLKYCKENHFTYLILYDLYYVLGNPAFESYLCSFIEKAKTQYCIEFIGVASSCAAMFDDVADIGPTSAFSLSQNYDAAFRSKMNITSLSLPPSDSLFYTSEVAKLSMRTSIFNNSCSNKLDVLVSEYEFWNTTTDDCVGDNPSRDQKYERYRAMIDYMDAIRDNYNLTNTHQIFVETYLGYIDQNSAYSHQTIADWIDGSYNGKRRADRILTHYYGSDASKLYSRTSSGWNNSGYYLNRFLDFCQPSTSNQTNLHPIFSSEYTYWGASASFLGSWFTQNVNNNIFTAEKIFYNDWYDDAQNYHPATVGSPVYGNVIHPGGMQWFASQYLAGHLNNPLLFTSNSPVCVPTGQNGNLTFQYQGPIEQGDAYKFYLTDAGGNTVVCGIDSFIAWPAYDAAIQQSIDLNAYTGGCSLPVGDYDAHLVLKYGSACTSCTDACSLYTAPPVKVSVVNSGKIVALSPTTVCQGNAVFLKASSTQGGSTTYTWYDGSSPINGATSSTYSVNPTAMGTHNYSCLITDSTGSCSANRSNVLPVIVNTYPNASVSVQSSSSCSVVLKANPSASTYYWQNGSTASTFTANYGGTYSVTVTKNGCSATASYTVQKISIQKTGQTNACGNYATGSITVTLSSGTSPYSLSWSGPANGILNDLSSGSSTISNLPTGNYTIVATDANGCSRSLLPTPFLMADTLMSWYEDADGDGFGNNSVSIQACTKPAGYITDSIDCDDSDFDIHPGIAELCNGKDDNCDGQTDEGCIIPLTMNVKVFIQGYYIAKDTMIAVVDSFNFPMLCDTVGLELHFAQQPFHSLYSSVSTLDIFGNVQFNFPAVYKDRYYYLVFKHRNALETWSKDSLLIDNSLLNYDFSDASTKAFGNNLVDLGDGNFAIWSGDVNDWENSGMQDGRIDSNDYEKVIDAAHQFVTGYSIYDLTGNGMVESADFSIVENNAVLMITLIKP